MLYFRTKNPRVKCWWNWHLITFLINALQFFQTVRLMLALISNDSEAFSFHSAFSRKQTDETVNRNISGLPHPVYECVFYITEQIFESLCWLAQYYFELSKPYLVIAKINLPSRVSTKNSQTRLQGIYGFSKLKFVDFFCSKWLC